MFGSLVADAPIWHFLKQTKYDWFSVLGSLWVLGFILWLVHDLKFLLELWLQLQTVPDECSSCGGWKDRKEGKGTHSGILLSRMWALAHMNGGRGRARVELGLIMNCSKSEWDGCGLWGRDEAGRELRSKSPLEILKWRRAQGMASPPGFYPVCQLSDAWYIVVLLVGGE